MLSSGSSSRFLDRDSSSSGRASTGMMNYKDGNPGNPSNSSGLPPPPSSGQSQRGGPLLEKFRSTLKDKEDEFNGSLSNSQIVALYRNALAELTFNSKPVITDLTIIAGELSYLSKEIANTVCNHILEVPIDQKLPSLYLLDSIVKNIGGDYVEFFSARLSEVFIKSYQQVDPSLYKSMNHLFRTWRDVFHPSPLHYIQRELNFEPLNPPSSVAGPSRAPPSEQAQRPVHRIHVNPKYLAEGRQQFEQSSLVEVSNPEINGELSSPEPERSVRSIREGPNVWNDEPRRPNSNIRPDGGDSFMEHGYGQKASAIYGDRDYSVSPPRASRPGRPQSPISRMPSVKPSSPMGRHRTGSRLASPALSMTGRDCRSVSPTGIGRDPRVPSPSLPSIARDLRMSSPQKPPMGRDLRDVSPTRAPMSRAPPQARGPFGRIPSPSVGIARRNERIVEPDNGWERSWPGKVEVDVSRPMEYSTTGVTHGQRNGYGWRPGPPTMSGGALIDAYGNYRGQRSSRGPLPYLHSAQDSEVSNPKMLSRNWRNSEEEEYLWEDMSPNFGGHRNKGSDPRKDDFSNDIAKLPVGDSDRRFGIDSVISDEWNSTGSYSHMDRPYLGAKENIVQRDPDDQQSYSHFPPGVGSRNREMTFETSLVPGNQGSFGHRSGPGQPTQLPPQNHSSMPQLNKYQGSGIGHGNSSTGLTSVNSTQPVTPVNDVTGLPSSQFPIGKAPSSANAASFSTEPVGFEYMPPSTSTSSNMSFPQRQQQPQRPTSPPSLPLQQVRPNLHPAPPAPAASLPLQQTQFQLGHQQTGFIKPGHPQIPPPFLSQGQAAPSFTPLHQIQQQNQQLPHLQQSMQSQAAASDLHQPPQNNSLGSQLPSLHQQINHDSQMFPQLQGIPQHSQYVQTPGDNSKAGLASNGQLLPPVPNIQSHQGMGRLQQPPLPPGPPPAASTGVTTSISAGPPSLPNVATLLTSLVAQGVISARAPATSTLPVVCGSSTSTLSQQAEKNVTASGTPSLASMFSILPPNVVTQAQNQPESLSIQHNIGTQFNSDVLKVRHEHVLRSLYEELPRQCTACGLRFRSQEDHRNHMDWHVSRNRSISKNRKQKVPQGISRRWFLNQKEWLSGTEVVTASESAPLFSPMETVPEKKESEEVCVPADESQNVCALCGEPFDDFYSDERDEWMYKGAVYMNAPNGQFEGVDKAELGPIVHAKCRSETVETPSGGSDDAMDVKDNAGNRVKRARYN